LTNTNILNCAFQHPASEAEINLYGSLKQSINNIDPSDLTWQDPEASMVLSDDSDIVRNLGRRQKSVFMEPRENMKCVLPDSVVFRCRGFVENFNDLNVPREMKNIFHDKCWKEHETKLLQITERVLGVL
jgi:hypothetical protein